MYYTQADITATHHSMCHTDRHKTDMVRQGSNDNHSLYLITQNGNSNTAEKHVADATTLNPGLYWDSESRSTSKISISVTTEMFYEKMIRSHHTSMDLSPFQARELANELLRFADSAEKAKREAA